MVLDPLTKRPAEEWHTPVCSCTDIACSLLAQESSDLHAGAGGGIRRSDRSWSMRPLPSHSTIGPIDCSDRPGTTLHCTRSYRCRSGTPRYIPHLEYAADREW